MRKVFYILLMAAVAVQSSCSKDYLSTTPTASVATPTVFATTENAKKAVNGLAKLMTMQYLSTQGFNGEGTIKMYYGNYPGNNFFVNLSGWADIINANYNERTSSVYCYYPWYYYYRIIGNANSIIVNVDDAVGSAAEKDFIKAQALTYRAYSFLMLSQLYSYRWEDSKGGSTKGVILRLDESINEMPNATLLETYNQIYKDLDDAIKLYASSGLSRSQNYEMDVTVAYAIYARAALTRQDWANAEAYAIKAKAGYPLMTNAEYKSGFCNPNQEWIWSSYGGSDETLYYFSYFSYMAYNSNASAVRSYPKCISKELFEKIPATDLRKGLFLDPTGYTYTVGTGAAPATSELYKHAFATHPAIYSTSSIYAYMQFKVSANDIPGVGHLNHFRSAEMYLIEAEAKYQQGKDAASIQDLLVALNKNSGRDASYTCDKTGTALLDEIKLYRSVELWGEGFDWFDMKRWNGTISRKSVNDGGNFITSLAKTIAPGAGNRWTWMVPLRETDYNTLAE